MLTPLWLEILQDALIEVFCARREYLFNRFHIEDASLMEL